MDVGCLSTNNPKYPKAKLTLDEQADKLRARLARVNAKRTMRTLEHFNFEIRYTRTM